MNRAQRRYRAKHVHGSRTYRAAVAERAAAIHDCNEQCIIQTVERPQRVRLWIATAVAIAFVVPILVITLLAAATYLFGN